MTPQSATLIGHKSLSFVCFIPFIRCTFSCRFYPAKTLPPGVQKWDKPEGFDIRSSYEDDLIYNLFEAMNSTDSSVLQSYNAAR